MNRTSDHNATGSLFETHLLLIVPSVTILSDHSIAILSDHSVAILSDHSVAIESTAVLITQCRI